jgi:hypothetical protein
LLLILLKLRKKGRDGCVDSAAPKSKERLVHPKHIANTTASGKEVKTVQDFT